MIARTCTASGKDFIIEDEDLDFYAKMGVITEEQKSALHSLQAIKLESPQVLEAEKIPENLLIGLPTLCPDERCRKRLSHQNMRNLYLRKCDATGKAMVSNVSVDKKFPVYDQKYWWSDDWDALDYGRNFDFSRSFFDQFQELWNVVPQPNVGTSHLLDENSEYTNYAGGNKNCYLIFHADMNRDCLYGVGIKKCTDIVDNTHVHGSELVYESIDCRGCYNLRFSLDCENCSDSSFLNNCVGCKNCFGCVNLRNKEFYFFNEKKTKEEYLALLKKFDLGEYSIFQKGKSEFLNFLKTIPQRSFNGYQNEEVSGDQIFRCKNVKESFDVQESRDMKFCHRVYNGPNSDCYDLNEYGMNIQKVYEGLAIGINANQIMSCIFTNEQVSDVFYSIHIHHAQDIFGCIGIVNKKYCILNKQYTKEAYENLRKKIIAHMKETGEWGQFFPTSMSPFGYNETVAQEYFPLPDPKELGLLPNDLGLYQSPNLKFQYKWKEEEQTSKYIGPEYKIPEKIKDVKDEILEKVLICKESGKPFKIQKAELAFYRKMNLPIPRLHPDVRHANRMKLRNPRKLWKRTCADCQCDIQTTFSPERPEKVLCEECYLGVVQ